jgi:DNA-binding transcriptional regulator YhcF (GntR family)
MIIRISPGGPPPTDQIHDQIRGLVRAGGLAAGQRLPSVRQLAGDLGVAPRTVAKAYQALEAEGIVTTSVGSGTRVSLTIQAPPASVLDAARALARAGQNSGMDADETVRILRAIWSERGGA